MSYNNNGIQVIQGTLSSANILSMSSTGIIVIPPPGAGLANFVLGGFFNAKAGSTRWTGGGNIWLTYGTTGADETHLASAFLTNQLDNMLANTNYVFGSGSGIGSDWLGGSTGTEQLVPSSLVINGAIAITVNSAYTAGNGSIDYTIFYATLKCE